jgi:hypothetical protein
MTAFAAIAEDREALHERLDELVTALRAANISGQVDGVRPAAESMFLVGKIALDLLSLAATPLDSWPNVIHLDSRNPHPTYRRAPLPVGRVYPMGGADLFSVGIASDHSGVWIKPEGGVGSGVLAVVGIQGERAYYAVHVSGGETDERDPS